MAQALYLDLLSPICMLDLGQKKFYCQPGVPVNVSKVYFLFFIGVIGWGIKASDKDFVDSLKCKYFEKFFYREF